MGVFKWLRRERLTLTTTRNNSSPTTPEEQASAQVGTIRTEEYKRDLAEFQARRSSLTKETPTKKQCGRHSLPINCQNCVPDADATFCYEKKSAIKYKKRNQKRARSANPDETLERAPNIQFLFQNQVFMPGSIFEKTPYTDPRKNRHCNRKVKSPEVDYFVQKQIDFDDDNDLRSPPLFFKNNSLPFDVNHFLEGSAEEVDGAYAAGDVKVSSQGSPESRKEDNCEDKLWEVMSELKNLDLWADEQLQGHSPNTTKSDDNKSDESVYGLPVTSASAVDVTMDRNRAWNQGQWGVVPVQIKKLAGITIEHVKKKLNTEINILRKYRHPNIILLMGIYPDINHNVHIICESFVNSLYGVLHEQGFIISAQTSVKYALDIANALVFLRMQGFVHSALSSQSIVVTPLDTAKLAELSPCAKINKAKKNRRAAYEVYSPEPQYVNIEDTSLQHQQQDREPLLSQRSSDIYLSTDAVTKPYNEYSNSERYRWHAPELFEPDDEGFVHPCSKSDVYSLCLILHESCNAQLPWKTMKCYNDLKEQYTLWKTGVDLPRDGKYPGSLLSLLQRGLTLDRSTRFDVMELQTTLQKLKQTLDNLEYIIIPARISKKKSDFSSMAWDTYSPTDSDSQSPIKPNIQHQAIIHTTRDSNSSESDKDFSKTDSSPMYETIRNVKYPEKCYISDDDKSRFLKYDILPEKDYSSACSTPIAKIKARIKDLGTPGALHRSDSTEYCSILSPNRTEICPNSDLANQSSMERSNAKLSRSFTPKSYKPLHIKLPDLNVESLKSLPKARSDRSSYNFDIKNYSLPTTPIARSNKLRKNAWLSGNLNVERSSESSNNSTAEKPPDREDPNINQSAPETPQASLSSLNENDQQNKSMDSKTNKITERSPESIDTARDSFSSVKRTSVDDSSPEAGENTRQLANSWFFKSTLERGNKYRIEEDVLANVNVKPLVAIHEKWIYEANRKTARSMSLPEDNRCQVAAAVKPASHCVDTLQKSLPQLYVKRSASKLFRLHPTSPNSARNGSQCEQFCQARDTIAKNIDFSQRDSNRFNTYSRDKDKGSATNEEIPKSDPKIDQATDTRGIEEFIRELIRKEFQHLLYEISDDASTARKQEELLTKGVANIVESLKNGDDLDQTVKRDCAKSFSRVKISGNNKPLLQITFSRSGENSLQVLDNCVNVTICDNVGRKDKSNQSMDDTLISEDFQVNSLKRCQAFNAIQEARSTEDLYIDDDLSTQMQENFGGKVKLIPLHGSLHEILCEKEDDCCLIKVKQENGCDTIYFKCDNSDTESRDAIDGSAHENRPQDTVVFKRSISLIEERIQRIVPKDKRSQPPIKIRKTIRKPEDTKVRPKSEVFIQKISKESRILSNSTPSLSMSDKNDEVEVNIENAMCYQDSSSDECLRCQDNDDFEQIERKIEEDLANNLSSMTCGCLEKISEENLSTLHEDSDRDRLSVEVDDSP